MEFKTIKAGTFPGEMKEYAITNETTVQQVLDMAGISYGAETVVTGDSNEVRLDALASNINYLVVTKRLKGAYTPR